MIRITGGTYRGRTLATAVPPNVRPTASRVREAVFSMVGQDLSGWSFLDLFGGSGLIALEAASRGAAPVVVVDRSPASVACIRANVSAMGAPVDVVMGDAALSRRTADIVYLDPPFKEAIAPWLVRVAPRCLHMLVAETKAPADWPEVLPGFVLDRARTYGDTAVALYVRVRTDAVDPEAGVVGEDGGVVEDDGGGERVE